MEQLASLGYPSRLIPLKTLGDIDLVRPIYAMGVQGVFTKELDGALLGNQADLAVHSLKDVPTILPEGLTIAAVLPRASYHDVLIYKTGFEPSREKEAIIATSSIRRRSQWLHRFSTHSTVNVRGNVETRLRKFEEERWDGIIFAKAGLERLGLLPENSLVLDWMIPAPAQGAIAVVCRGNDLEIYNACRKISHEASEVAVMIERNFLYHLEGGCSVPISALVNLENDGIHFIGAVHSVDGTQEMKVEVKVRKEEWKSIGKRAAQEVRDSDKGSMILEGFRKLNRS